MVKWCCPVLKGIMADYENSQSSLFWNGRAECLEKKAYNLEKTGPRLRDVPIIKYNSICKKQIFE